MGVCLVVGLLFQARCYGSNVIEMYDHTLDQPILDVIKFLCSLAFQRVDLISHVGDGFSIKMIIDVLEVVVVRR